MSFLPDFSRRGFIRLAAAAPLLGQIAAKNAFASAATALGKDPRQNVYTRLGVKTIINCRGTWTYLSGSLEFPEVQAAQREAAEYFVNMFELQHAASRRLAELTGAEAGMVTSGAAGAMASAAAACMAGSDPKYIWQLPDTTGLKQEVIMVGGRSALSNALLPPTMMTSCFSPVVSGSCQIYFGSLPAMHAAAADAMAPAAPEVTMPASAPVNSARRRLAACCNSNMFTKYSEASRCAARTSGNSNEPLKYVQVPRQLMMVFTPRRV